MKTWVFTNVRNPEDIWEVDADGFDEACHQIFKHDDVNPSDWELTETY